MKNKLILFCLLICPVSFASKPLPAAGAGAGAGLPSPVAPAQARAAAQSQASQVDVKQLQEQQKKDSAKIAQLAAEIEALKSQANKDKEEPKQKLLCSWNCKLSGKDEWTDEVMIKFKDSDKFLILTSIYDVQEGSILMNNVFSTRFFHVKKTKINCAKSVTEDEKLSLVIRAMNFKMIGILNGLQANGAFDALNGILSGNGSCEITP